MKSREDSSADLDQPILGARHGKQVGHGILTFSDEQQDSKQISPVFDFLQEYAHGTSGAELSIKS